MDDRISAYRKNMGQLGGAHPKNALPNGNTSASTSAKPPLDIGAFIKETPPSSPPSPPPPSAPSSKSERLVKFIALIGEENSAKLLSKLSKAERAIVLKNAEELRQQGKPYGMTSKEAADIYEEFKEALSAEPPSHFGFLEDFRGEQVALILHKEGAQTCAVVLARLTPKLAAETLHFIDKEKRKEIALRIARLKPVSPEIIAVIAGNLRDRARELGKEQLSTVTDGVSVLAEILKNTDLSAGGKIVEGLAEDNPLLAETLREKLYSLDDVCRADDRAIAEKLEVMTEKEIALLTRGRQSNFVEKIMFNISAGRRAIVKEEDELMGAVLKTDSDAALKDFLKWFRENRYAGKLLFMDEERV